ncbi:MAG TPA: S9 family peptidase [Chthoniobacterales bacterium]|nr:S9 family peptidase [Chthoniobacterales bacterium]
MIYRIDSETPGTFHLYRVDIPTAKEPVAPVDLTPIPGMDASVIDQLDGISDTEILVSLNERNRAIYDACRVNILSPKQKDIHVECRNTFNALGWIADNTGCIRAAIAKDGTDVVLFTRPDANSQFQEALRTYFTDLVIPQCYTASNDAIYAISNVGRDKKALVIIDAATGKELRCIYENPDADIEPDIDTIGFSRKRKVVTYVSFHTSKRGLQTFDSSTAAIFSSLETKLPGYALDLVSQNEDENKFIVMAWNDRTPGARYVFDSQTGHLKKLADVAPWLNEKELAPVQPISVETSDHLIVHGYLTLPLQGEGKNLPLVVNVHSGPWWRDRWEYIAPESAEVQLLANRGYAVLQLNFRGSIGYGRAFWKAGFKEWGRKMQQDLTDGVKWLIGRGIVDPKRIAIYGKSYGGYAALAGVTFTPELYKAGIDYAGESNMLTYMEKFPPSTKSEMPEYYAKVGNPVTETSFLAAVSPALHAEKIKAPLFIAHGDQDPIVSRTESDQMVAALHGVDVEYMVKAKEGHIFQNEENKIDFYTAIEAFLAKHLRKDASPLTDGQTGAIGE